MNIARLTSKRKSLAELQPLVTDLLNHIIKTCSPLKVFLIGSAVRGEFTLYSDIDFVIIVEDDEALRKSRERVYRGRPHYEVPVDFLMMTLSVFERMNSIGGLAFEANHYGKLIYQGEEK